MKILNVSQDSQFYTANVYLLTGSWNRMGDINTLVDVGRDPAVIEKICAASTGVGKTRVERVILTHSHYDHASLLPAIKQIFHPHVYAYSSYLEGIDSHLKGGEQLKVADRCCEVIHTPGHSCDSICLYCEEEQILFAGDTPLIIRSPGGTYEDSFVKALEQICQKEIKTIYFGHGDPLANDCNRTLRFSLENVYKSLIIREK